MKLFFNISLILFFFGQIYGQYGPRYEHLKRQYPKDDLIILDNTMSINVSLQKGKPLITSDEQRNVLFLNNKAKFSAEGEATYSSFYQLDKVEASTLIFENGKYKELKVEEFKEKDKFSNSVFYDDVKSLNFLYLSLQEGAVAKKHIEETYLKPRLLKSFFFGDFQPVIKSRYEVVVDDAIDMDFILYNIDSSNLVYKKSKKGNKIYYSWSMNNLPKLKSESSAPNYRYSIPHIIPIIRSYTVKGKKELVLANIDGLHDWYYSMVNSINKDSNYSEMQSLVDSLVFGLKNEEEIVKAIFYWTQENVKYVAFEASLGGFIPREANDILNKKYGDCKDNTSVMKKMMELAGIETAYFTWIGTRSIPYFYQDVSTPVVDNHMILTYQDTLGVIHFLDGTGRFIPFNENPAFIQGKEALISKGKDNYEIVKVPISGARSNLFVDSVEVFIDENKLYGEGTFELSGMVKNHFLNDINQRKTKDSKMSFYKRMLMKGSNKFLVDSVDIDLSDLYKKKIKGSYSFNIEDYVFKQGENIYVNFNFLAEDIRDVVISKKRENDIENDAKFEQTLKVIFKIPDTFELSYLPSNFSMTNEDISSSIEYISEANSIRYTYTFSFINLLWEKERFKEINEVVNSTLKEFKEVIVLKRK